MVVKVNTDTIISWSSLNIIIIILAYHIDIWFRFIWASALNSFICSLWFPIPTSATNSMLLRFWYFPSRTLSHLLALFFLCFSYRIALHFGCSNGSLAAFFFPTIFSIAFALNFSYCNLHLFRYSAYNNTIFSMRLFVSVLTAYFYSSLFASLLYHTLCFSSSFPMLFPVV